MQFPRDTVAFFGIGPSGNTAEESVQVCKWLEEAGVDAFHASTGSFFPHPRNPAGTDLPVEDLVQTYDMMISGGEQSFRTYTLFRMVSDGGLARPEHPVNLNLLRLYGRQATILLQQPVR